MLVLRFARFKQIEVSLVSHGLVIGLRTLWVCAIVAALPQSHLWWGESSEAAGVDGPTAFAFLVIFVGIGAVVAIAFMVVASVAHFLLRKHLRIVPLLDAGFAAALMTFLIVAGITATYSTAS